MLGGIFIMETGNKMDYQASDILQNMRDVMNKKGLLIAFLFIINISFTILFQFLFKNNILTLLNARNIDNPKVVLNAFDFNFILSILLLIVLTTFIYGLLTRITFNEMMHFEKKHNSRSIMTQLFQYLLFSFVFYIIIFVGMLVFVIVGFVFAQIPLLGILIIIGMVIGLIIAVFYYVGYYRFIPYIALAEGIDDVFGKSKKYIKGHLTLSIVLIIFNSVISNILSNYSDNVFRDDKMIIFIILTIITQIFSFSLIFFDIAFVFTGYKREYLINQENLKDDELKIESQVDSWHMKDL